MKSKIVIAILAFLLVSLVFSSGCLGKKAACGNDLLEEGEECDGGGCAPGEDCIDCKCVASAAAPSVPKPPSLPK